MLNYLRISGLALLEDCELLLGPGLTAITGETGAGKTMVLTSLRLITGGRSETKMVAQDRDRMEVDAVIAVDPVMSYSLEEAGFAVEDGLATFSRTIASQGRSTASVAGRPVPARILTETAGSLITIHGQADQWQLKSNSHQRDLLDSFAPQAHQEIMSTYSSTWKQVEQMRRRVEELEGNKDRLEVELRYLKSVLHEVEELDPSESEEDDLQEAIDRLTYVEQLQKTALSALRIITGGQDAGAEDLLGDLAASLTRSAHLDTELSDLAKRAEQIEVEVQALSSDLRAYAETLFDDPDQLAELHQRRATLTELMRGRAASAAELLVWAVEAKVRIAQLESDEADPLAARQQLDDLTRRLKKQAGDLLKSRQSAAKSLAEKVNAELAGLALPNAKFSVAFEPIELGPHGGEKVTMMLQPHPKALALPLGEGASGGELSRIMLALEVVLANVEGVQTLIFDEIDAGIGGVTANHVGQRLKRLSKSAQVIVVTHLAQIAALADHNFVVEKKDGSASVRQVSGESRTEEIVRMLGGDDGSGAARRHAVKLESGASVRESKS